GQSAGAGRAQRGRHAVRERNDAADREADPRSGPRPQPREPGGNNPDADADAHRGAAQGADQGGEARGRECAHRRAQPPARRDPAPEGSPQEARGVRERRAPCPGRGAEDDRPAYRRDRQAAATKRRRVDGRMNYTSSTQEVPEHGAVPRHLAIIMDGNGRWARSRLLPRIAGHRRGLEAVRATVENCAERGIEFLTLFAFSSENWRRPAEEVALLMQLFQSALTQEAERLHRSGVRLKVVGDLERFGPKLQRLIDEAEALTAENRGLT